MVMGSKQVTKEVSVTSASASANMDLNSSTPTLVGELPHLHLSFPRIGLLVVLVQIKASPIRRNASPFARSTSVSQCMLAVRKVLLRAIARTVGVEMSTGLAMLRRTTYSGSMGEAGVKNHDNYVLLHLHGHTWVIDF